MAKHLLLLAALLSAGYAQADNSKANIEPTHDVDGFTQPLKLLKFNPGLDQREFERATMNALNVYDPLESVKPSTSWVGSILALLLSAWA